MSEDYNRNNTENENEINEAPVIISRKEEPVNLIVSDTNANANEQNHIYRWNTTDESNINNKNAKKAKKNAGIKIFAAVMSLMFLISATFTIFLAAEQFNSGESNPAAVLSNHDAVEESKNNSGDNISDANAIEDTVITIPESNANAGSKILTTEEAIAKVNPSVVCIQTEAEVTYGSYFGRGSSSYNVQGVGTGFIVSDEGYIATNYHVVENADKITVTLYNGEVYEASLIGGDEVADLAVIKINAKNLPVAELGDSDALVQGQSVVAIGTPAGIEFAWTATGGMVSAINRVVDVNSRKTMTVIQTDASINPGNSGGPLLDTQGRMIGLNTMIYSPSGGSVGIGFAIPVNTAKRVVNELIVNGKVRRGWIDANMVQLFPNLVRYAKIPVSSGLLVSRIKRGGLAEKAGLRQGSEPVQYGRSVIYIGGDIITAVDGMKIGTLADLYSALENHKPGDRVKLNIIRGEQPTTLELTLVDRDEVMQ